MTDITISHTALAPARSRTARPGLRRVRHVADAVTARYIHDIAAAGRRAGVGGFDGDRVSRRARGGMLAAARARGDR